MGSVSSGYHTSSHYPEEDSAVTARVISVAGDRVRVVEAGPAGGFAVVLLHGWGGSAYNFRGVIGKLADTGFRVVAPDLRGHGWTESESWRGAWTVQAMTDWVRQLLDALGVQRAVVVGQSIGGALALDAAAAMPDRIVALVLLSPVGFTPIRRVALARAFRFWHPSSTPRWVVAAILRRIYGTRGRWTERDVDEYWVPLRRKAVVSTLLQAAREFDFTPRQRALPDELRVVIRFGELDGLIPHRAAVAHAARFRGADVAVLTGVGHVPAEEVPDEVVELVKRVAMEVTGQRPEGLAL